MSAPQSEKQPEKQPDDQNPVARAVTAGLEMIYERVAVRKDSTLSDARYQGLVFETWDEYQRRAPFTAMDDIADAHIKTCKVSVSALGAAAGFGGFAAMVPDALQFVTLTLRMVTGIASAYGFDPDPKALDGKVKLLVLQAYLNANLGQTAYKGTEAVALSAATRLFTNVANRADWLILLLGLIGRIIGIRITRQGILRTIPLVSSGVNAGFNWHLAQKIARSARAEFKQFRDDLRLGKYKNEPDYAGLGN
jgi:hypothetical protein